MISCRAFKCSDGRLAELFTSFDGRNVIEIEVKYLKVQISMYVATDTLLSLNSKRTRKTTIPFHDILGVLHKD